VTRDPKLDPHLMALRGRIGGHVTHSRHSTLQTTARARAAFLASFETAVDPDGVLPTAERLRRAQAARRAHMARLAYASARARAKRGRKGRGRGAA
jgi:hypothetical protein